MKKQKNNDFLKVDNEQGKSGNLRAADPIFMTK